jgi:hypothetical protein
VGLLTSGGEELRLQRLLELLGRVLPPHELAMIESSLAGIVRRLLEVALASDEKLRPIVRFRDIYAGRADRMITERILGLGLSEEVDESDIRHLRLLLLEGAQPSGREAEIIANSEYVVFRDLQAKGTKELRCGLCGYHFRAEDLSRARTEYAAQFDLVLAARKRAERLSDMLKNPQETKCEIDHRIPRAGWGPTRTENLQLLCQYCNQGKLSYRWWGELLPVTVAGSLPSITGEVLHWQLRSSFVATLMRDGSVCRLCNRDCTSTELSVRRLDTWTLPIRLQTVCYDCGGDK